MKKTSKSAGAFPIVGVGASAGGLEAFTILLQNLPADTGMAFVLIQHLDPTHASILSDALAKVTKMPVCQVENGISIEPNRVYVIPSNADITVHAGKLTSQPRLIDSGKPHLPVDVFLRSLAVELGSRAIGVVLSGTASDGTAGLRAIKDENGITFVQDPRTAKFEGMPQSALDAGVGDYRLPIPQLAAELVRLSRHPYVVADIQRAKTDEDELKKLFVIVRKVVGVDYSEYKSPTFDRRLARRMALRRVENLSEYVALLQSDEQEARTLHEEVLIHVTSFFRDPEVFEALKSNIFPEILKYKAQNGPVRLWVAGCASGEEVYSLAIALMECLSDEIHTRAIQIFGSDVSEQSIAKARAGLYSESALRDVSDERRRRYFSKFENGYRINKSIRDLCVFVRHDLARDPPFSKIDLVSCRNVLIYFDQDLQKRVLPTFHYCLSQPGFLLLGRTESISGFGQLFSVASKAFKIFSRTSTRSLLRFAPRSETHPPSVQVSDRTMSAHAGRGIDLAKHLDRLLSASYAPPSVLVNDRMEILQFRGQTGPYLQPAPGEAENNLLKMARGGLLAGLRETIARAQKGNEPVRKSGVEVDDDGQTRICDIVVRPFIELPDVKENLFIVLFEQGSQAPLKKSKLKSDPTAVRQLAPLKETARLKKLGQELQATKEYLLALMEENGRTNDDLGATNEELLSGNEELQSLNEELETAKEELQSTNEELTTVNDELHSRNEEVFQINSDLVNLLSAVEIPIVILDSQRHIRRFTPKARHILNVVASDIGRDFGDIKPNINVPDLDDQIAEVMETLVMKESEVQDRNKSWYRMQIRPYKTTDNRIDGVILSLMDINLLKHHVSKARTAKGEAERANLAKDQFLAMLSHELRTPLSSLMLRTQALSRAGFPSEKIKSTGEAILRGAETLERLIDDLLDVSRIVTGKLSMDLRAVDLRLVVNASLDGISLAAESKSIELTATFDDSLKMVIGDAARLQQVVSNLLSNAVKFTPAFGKVDLVVSNVNDRAQILIKDTGLGIDSSFVPHLFDRFSQADMSSTRANGGLGLGLAISRHILEQHGGDIRAESPGLGLGSTFVLSVPFVQSETVPNDSVKHA